MGRVWDIGYRESCPSDKAWMDVLLGHEELVVYLAGQVFLWFEWSYFLFITVALWNASSNHLRRSRQGGPENIIWGQLGRALALPPDDR